MIFESNSQFQQCKKEGVGRTTIQKYLGKSGYADVGEGFKVFLLGTLYRIPSTCILACYLSLLLAVPSRTHARVATQALDIYFRRFPAFFMRTRELQPEIISYQNGN